MRGLLERLRGWFTGRALARMDRDRDLFGVVYCRLIRNRRGVIVRLARLNPRDVVRMTDHQPPMPYGVPRWMR